jgi:hypothetical protein
MRTSTQQPSRKMPAARKVLCKQCYRQLCQMTTVHNGKDEQSALLVKHKRMEIMGFLFVITCPNCRSKYRIEAGQGITDEYVNSYHNRRAEG